jgi:hypothetical protein
MTRRQSHNPNQLLILLEVIGKARKGRTLAEMMSEAHVRHFKDQRLVSCRLRLQRCSCFDVFIELSFADEEFFKYFLE